MSNRLFTDTFFKKNDYFRKELKIDDRKLAALKGLIINWQEYLKAYTKRIDKETTDEGEFIKVVFEKILGYHGKGTDAAEYTLSPKYPIERGGIKGGTGFSDLALGCFSKESQTAQVLIEFKDQTSNNLDKPSTRKDKYSPVDQCWHYLNSYKGAKWGIVTNFNEIRLYNKNEGKQKCEVFYFIVPEEIKDKAAPLSVDSELFKFISILKAENLLSNEGVSFSEDILSKQGVEEKRVQKEFYSRYRDLRVRIFQGLLEHNPEFNQKGQKTVLLTLVQKLLDRIIFCWFCEDSREHLLPSNILTNTINEQIALKYYKDIEFNVWESVKSLFRAIDEGGNFNISSGYNGGLFKSDPKLDRLTVPNIIFKEIARIGELYDFGDENELNVNILGHIFEQSITDLEEIRFQLQELEQDEQPSYGAKQETLSLNIPKTNKPRIVEFDINKSKRKQEGVYYTPDHITNFIVKATVGQWLDEKYLLVNKHHEKTKKDKERKVLIEYRDKYLKKIKILDPACGSGAFLVAAFNYLFYENQRVHKMLYELDPEKSKIVPMFDNSKIDGDILENNLYGVDLNKESVEITRLSLWLKTAIRGKPLKNLDRNIKCGNSLIDDPNIAGEKGFVWEKEFPDIIKYGATKELEDGSGFDCVIGNPPYDVLSEKETGREIENEVKFYKKDPILSYSIKGKNNLYKLFVCKGLSLTRNGGYFSFIVPMSLIGDEQSSSVRGYLFRNSTFNVIHCFPQKDDPKRRVFEEAKLSTCIFNVKKGGAQDKASFKVLNHPGKYFEADYESALSINEAEIRSIDKGNLTIPSCSKDEWAVIKKIKGIQYFAPLGNYATQYQGEVNETNEKDNDTLTDNTNYPMILRGSNITMYCVREASQGEQLYLNDVNFLKDKSKDSKAYHHNLNRVGFQRSSPQNNFRRIIAAPIIKGLYCFDTVSYVTSDSTAIDLDVLLALLNSRLYDWYFGAISTNSKVNEYQFNNLPYVEAVKKGQNNEYDNCIKNQQYAEAINILSGYIKDNEQVPLWAFDLLKILSQKIQVIEGKRMLNARKERAFLDPESQKYQRYIDATIYSIFQLDSNDVSLITNRSRK
jgi:Alw26I/Eco31I/Esp3I family type II restriction m6 adenine DNA methyltransferase